MIKCEYWCNNCGGTGEIEVWRNEEPWQCGRCNGTGNVDKECSCGKCSKWFSGKIDVEFIHEIEKLKMKEGE